MKDLGLMYYFLGLDVYQRPGEFFLFQGKYVVKLLERFGMVDRKSVTIPMELNLRSYAEVLLGLIWEFLPSIVNSWEP